MDAQGCKEIFVMATRWWPKENDNSKISKEMRDIYMSVLQDKYKLYCNKKDHFFPTGYEVSIVRHETESSRSLTDWTGTIIPISFEVLQDIDERYLLQPDCIVKMPKVETK